MQDFIEFFKAQMEMGMLPFSIPMFLCVLFWLFMIVGVLDLEILDSVFGIGDGAADGAADGVLDGTLDGAADGVADGAVDGAMDGGLDGAGESVGAFATYLHFLNFGLAPATIVITFFSFFMWFFANIGRNLFGKPAGMTTLAAFGFFAATFISCLLISSILTHFSAKPFRKLMAICTFNAGIHMIGKVCIIKSISSTSGTGRGEFTPDGGSPIILTIMCEKENELKDGSKAVIVDYEKDTHRYVVEPMF